MKNIVCLTLILSICILSGCSSIPDSSSVPLQFPDYIYPEKYFAYQGAKVAYIDGGNPEGETIIFLHGVLMNSHGWRYIMKALEDKYHVVSIDLPGYGKSARGKNLPLSIAYYTNMIREFIDTQQLEKPTLVGISLGGHIALYYALHYPHEISRVAVVGSVGVDEKMSWLEDISYKLLWREAVIGRIMNYKKWEAAWKNQFNCTDQYDEEFYTLPIFHDKKANDEFNTSFRYSVGSIFLTSLREYVHRIEVPLLILWGGQDHHHKVWDGYYLHEKVKNSKLAISPHCGHLLMLDDPEFFNRALTNWLETGDPQVPQYTLEEILKLGQKD